MVDATLALAEFDRWLKAHDFSDDENEERHFYDWLPRWYADPADRAAITATWDARFAERCKQRDREAAERQMAFDRETAEIKRQRAARDADAASAIWECTSDENEVDAYHAWWRSLDQPARDKFADGGSAVDYWYRTVGEPKYKAEAATTARREQEREQAERKRADLVEHLKDLAWARGEDAASLRAVAAWRRVYVDEMVFKLKEGTARDALQVADQALMAEIQASVDAIAAAKARNAQDPLLRAARGEQDEPVPPPLDLRAIVDRDAVARWLAAHREDLATFEAGRWRHQWNDPDGESKWIDYQWTQLDGFRIFGNVGEIQRQAARWTAYWAIEAKATAYPDAAAALHELGLKVLTGERHDTVDYGAWEFQPEKPPSEYIGDPDDDEPEQEPRTEGEIPRIRRPPSPARQRSKLIKRIESAIRKGYVTKTAIYDAVGGKRETVVELLRELVADGTIQEPDDDHGGYWLDGE